MRTGGLTRGWLENELHFGFGPKLRIIMQTEAAECGLACLGMILSYHGHYTDISSLRREFPVSIKGLTLSEIVKVAQRLKLNCRAVRLDLDDISHLRLPAILHWDLSHFVVAQRIRGRKVTIVDPAYGRQTLNLQALSEHFTGVALEVWPSPDFKTQTAQISELRVGTLVGKTIGLPRQILSVVALAVGIEALTLLMPLATQWIIDYVIVSHDRDLLTTIALGFGLVLILQQALTAIRSLALMHLGTTLSVQWQSNVFSHLIRLPVDYFQKRHLGDIVSRFGSVDQIQNTLTTSSIAAILDGLMSIATLALMLIYSPKLTAVTIGAIGLYVLLRVLTYAPLRGNTQKKIIFMAKQQSHFLETMRGIKAIKLFQREDHRRLAWLQVLVQQINASLRTQLAQIAFQTANGLLFGAEKIIVLCLGAQTVIDGNFTVGILMAFLSYREQFNSRVISLTDKYFEFRMLRLHAGRLSDIVLAKPEISDEELGAVEFARTSGAVEFINVRFRYSPFDSFVLQGLNIKIEDGESVAIIGPSGAGKTTLMNILLGILKPTAGTVRIGELDIADLGTEALRTIVRSVSQDDTLFAGSIAANIAFFDTNPDADRIEECARLAAIHDDICSMSMGYRTLIGDMGMALSGGQKQRLLIARALYSKPKILVLDEATSHLDLECEAVVNAAIKSLHITRIIVAHRPETFRSADRIVAIHDGRVLDGENSGPAFSVAAPTFPHYQGETERDEDWLEPDDQVGVST